MASIPASALAPCAPRLLHIPNDLVLGVSTSAHQVEGGDVHSDWWDFEQQPGRIRHGDRSGRAADFWGRFEQDVRLMADHGVEAHRMGVSWARIEPRDGHVDESALEHYAEIIESHRRAGIRVAVTLLHFALPRWFAGRGGVLAADAPARFGAFVRLVARALRGKVWQWHTVNEPSVMIDAGYRRGIWPPGKRHIGHFRQAMCALLRLHVAAARAVREMDDAPVGIVHSFPSLQPAAPESWLDRFASRVGRWCATDVLIEALGTGRLFPPLGAGETLDGLRGSNDLIGVNYYQGFDVSLRRRPILDDGAPDVRRTQMGWTVRPEGLVHVLEQAAALGVPIWVTENGIATDDDLWRQRFIVGHLASLVRARARGVDVRGYFYWSWIDNFEWAEGFEPRFGLVAVDPRTLDRRPRPSAKLFARLSRERSCDLEQVDV